MNILLVSLIILLVFGGLVVGFVLLMLSLRRSAQTADQTRRRLEAALEEGTLASAELVSARTLSVREGDAANLVRVTLRVLPPTGEEYVAVNTWEVKMEAMGVLQPGQTLAVIIDRNDPKQVSSHFNGARLAIE